MPINRKMQAHFKNVQYECFGIERVHVFLFWEMDNFP